MNSKEQFAHELDITMAHIKFNSTCLFEEIFVDLLQKLHDFHSLTTYFDDTWHNLFLFSLLQSLLVTLFYTTQL